MIKDVQRYFVDMQKQMNEANKALEQVNKEIEAGLVSNEQRDSFTNWYWTVKNNYDRLAYIMYLLHKPPIFIQKLREKKLLKEQEKFLAELEKNATKEVVEEENKECLDNITELLKDIQPLDEESSND